MTVRAKFTYTGYSSSLTPRQIDPSKGWDATNLEQVEMRSLRFSPVYGNGDPNHENTRLWQATPSGSVELGTVNPEAWAEFELGREYYLDFTAA
jgi:hypothetical protein